ncbi:MAG: hypothetical protein ACI9NN_001568, partial [Bacteroidia bacterium]
MEMVVHQLHRNVYIRLLRQWKNIGVNRRLNQLYVKLCYNIRIYFWPVQARLLAQLDVGF